MDDVEEAKLRQQRFEAYFRGEVFTAPEAEAEAVEVEAAEAQAAQAAKANVFSEEELQKWTPETAILKILSAKNSFEVLGVSPSDSSDLNTLRNRYRKLSLLVHPDKNKETAMQAQATEAFQRLSDGMRVLVDDSAREQLIQEINEQTEPIHEPLHEPTETPKAQARDESDEDALSQQDEEVRNRLMQRSNLNNLNRLVKRRKKSKKSEAQVAGVAGMAQAAPAGHAYNQGAAQGTAPSTAQDTQGDQRPNDRADGCAPHGCAQVDSFAKEATSEQLTELWQQGALGAGWQRLESRRQPGNFYFAHSSGITVMQKQQWEMRQSRRDPTVSYWVNLQTGETRLAKDSISKPDSSA